MRVPRTLLAAGAIALLTGPLLAQAAAAAPLGRAGAIVRIAPGVIHLGPVNPVPGITANAGPPTTAQCEATLHVACYDPAQIEAAYDLAPLFTQGINGSGQTIIIVDSFGSPTIGHDLNVFDKAFGLPAPPSLTVIQPAGPVPPYVANNNREGWAGETTLDVEYSHVMAPDAHILLVETPTSENEGTSGFAQIETAEKYVIDHHLGGVISQSFSATEQSFPTAQSLLDLRGAYLDAARKGVTVLAAAGDSGAADVGPDGSTYYLQPVTSWPDSDPLVTGIGGTQLQLDAQGNRTSPDVVWNDTDNTAAQEAFFGNGGPNPLAGGGGKSIIFKRPAFQDGVSSVVGSQRGVPDISMSAACDGAVDVYQGFPGQTGWYPTCGTSEATPLFAGVVALADQDAGHTLGAINPKLYALSAASAPGVVDVTSGNNTVAFTQGGSLHTVTGFPALAGYDLASGVGTVDAAQFVPELAGLTKW